MTRSLAPALVALSLLLTGAADCELDVVADPGFQFWCGEELCEWDRTEGNIARVPTWHDHDYAVELLGSPVELSQPFTTSVYGCILIELTADAEPEALVTLAIDQDVDGVAEWVAAVDQRGFQRMSWRLDVEVSGDGTDTHPASRMIIRKDGEGRAVLSQLRVSKRCDGRPEFNEL
ncbi:MAG: hypothetical protein AAGF92_03115 [Myxococcota bacterium]